VAIGSVVERRWPALELSSGARGGHADSGSSAVEPGLQLRCQGEHLHPFWDTDVEPPDSSQHCPRGPARDNMRMNSHPDLIADGHALFFLEVQPGLDWAADGDEFIDNLDEQLVQVTGVFVTGSLMAAVPFEQDGKSYSYRRYTFSGPTLETALAAIPLSDGRWLLAVEATDVGQARTEEHVWVAAIRGARADVGRACEHPWWAVVAPVSPVAGPLVLDRSCTISGITLAQPVAPYARYARVPGPRRLGGGGQVEVIYPVVARGRSRRLPA